MRVKSTVLATGLVLGLAPSICNAAIINHEDPGNSFTTSRGALNAPVGRLTVNTAQTISGFGVDVDLNGNSDLNFLIFNSDTGALLFQSGFKAFLDTGFGYKYSNTFSFTFSPGTTYGLTATSTAGGQYFVDRVPNTVGSFNFLTGNQNVSGTQLDESQACCDVGTSLVVSSVPLPPSAPMFGAAVLALGIAGYGVKRKKAAASA